MPEVSATPGDLVRAYNVPSTSNNGQFFAMGSPKDMNPTTTRSSITTPDVPTTGDMNPTSVAGVNVKDAVYLWVGGSCDVPTGEINFVVAHVDNSGNVLNISSAQSLEAAPRFKVSSRYVATPGLAIDVLGATTVHVLVTSVTGNWTLYYKPSY